MIEEAIEIMRMTETEILFLQNTIQLSEIISVVNNRAANFISHSCLTEIFVFDEERHDAMMICFRVGNSHCAIELACPKWMGMKSLCERSNFLNEISPAYSIVDRRLLAKILPKELVGRLREKIDERFYCKNPRHDNL